MRANLGCGPHKADGWVNVDRESGRGDLQAELTSLPFDPESLDAIYCGHVLEHLTYTNAGKVLAHARTLLKPGGQLLAVGPDIHRAAKMYAAGQIDLALLQACGEGADHTARDRHRWACHEKLLRRLFVRAGYRNVTTLETTDPALRGWPIVSHVTWQCAVLGTA
jgi:predicted SAM-dependent methyltransferase